MSSHVVVIDSSARRAVIKTTPTKYLSDVLQEACTKLGVDASQYGLKNNKKQVDLSRTIRLSGLSSGAKLELVLLSRSASVVSVALQLPEAEAGGIPNGRLTAKFPSTTTLWLVLRKFEAGAAGGLGTKKNLTARGIPRTSDGNAGSGRLYYETPVLQVMGRELSSFTDLQKTLGQLGFNNGSTLLRLSFKALDTSLEEAMDEIEQYFRSTEEGESAGAHAGSVATIESVPEAEGSQILGDTENMAGIRSPPEPVMDSPTGGEGISFSIAEIPQSEIRKAGSVEEPDIPDDDTIVGPGHRPMSVFAPPSNDTPQAAHHAHNEADYEPTIDHAKLHQSRLTEKGRNKRLRSEAEIKAQDQAASEKLSNVTEVEIKIRYPDQTQVVSKFTATDTSATLYTFAGSMLEFEGQPFSLSYSSPKGPKPIPRDGPKSRLIWDLGFYGRMLVNFVWDESASVEARSGRALKEEFQEKAKEIKVGEMKGMEAPDDGEDSSAGKGKEKAVDGGKEGRKGMPKWLKLPGKK
ncbi:MAG: hypothetical protein M1827_003010 [Pycnora praestabilis]|nr:MAG: hypothetical protein M1827_003010 [Pycnora praestabilis]